MLGAAARLVAQYSSDTGAVHVASFNAVATNARLLVAARLSAAPLYYALLEGAPQCEACGLLPGRSEVDPVVRAHARSRAVAVASHLRPGARWLELPSGQALAVGPELAPSLISF
jgi:hypothetical protein